MAKKGTETPEVELTPDELLAAVQAKYGATAQLVETTMYGNVQVNR